MIVNSSHMFDTIFRDVHYEDLKNLTKEEEFVLYGNIFVWGIAILIITALGLGLDVAFVPIAMIITGVPYLIEVYIKKIRHSKKNV